MLTFSLTLPCFYHSTTPTIFEENVTFLILLLVHALFEVLVIAF